MPAQSELGTFLQTRRAAVAPEDVGLPAGERRRVPGLRREEVAMLVGLSPDYYTRLEQGRGGNPSEGVLDGIARVLRLSRVEATHLHDLARGPGVTASPRRPARPPVPAIAPGLKHLIDTIDVPAVALTRCSDVIGWNALGARLLTDFGALPERERNIARLLFGETDFAALHRDWDASARDHVGMLRMTAGRNPENVRLQELVGELAVRSDHFRRLWGEHHVHEKTRGPKPIRHPELGDVDLHYETLLVACEENQLVVTYTAQPGTPSAEALALLRTLVASDAASATPSC